ncbi:SNF5-like protein [Coniochaeta sp. 2T2.1]|nr:SNF5-like protein [Coniochaeta sp. 2T2.1]
MAAAQATALPAAASASDAPANDSQGSGSGSGGESSSAPASQHAASASSKPGTPQEADPPKAEPERDKDLFNKLLVERYMTRDWIQQVAMVQSGERQNGLVKELRKKIEDYSMIHQNRASFPPARLYGEGYNGYGNGYTEAGNHFKIVYPNEKFSRKPIGKRTTPLKFSKKDLKRQADQHEELVPVRVDVDWDKVKLRDTFTWNLHERLIQPETFAGQLVEDIGLKAPMDKPVYDQVVAQIKEQLNDFYPFAYSEEDALDPELPYSAYKNDEMRILVRLNITIGTHTLVDQFEWEINNPMNSPEEFASSMARDLALSGEFTTAIAHCIREQAQLFTRSLYSIGHPFDGRPIEDPDLTQAFLPSPIPSVFRPQQQAKDFAPYLYELTEADLEKNETIISREQRRQKRSVNRRGGPSLPDLKDRPKTIRTLIVSSVLPGAVGDIEDSRLFKKATGAVVAGGRGKRALRDGDLSDSESSDDSAPDSPAIANLQGTARTRGLRGAASAAVQRMANIGRSETPEATIHHHETRTSRRFGRELTREQTEEPRLMVTLRVTPAKLRLILQRNPRIRQPPASGSATPTISSQHHHRAHSTSMGPPTTPSAANHSLPPKSNIPATAGPKAQLGRLPAPPPPPAGERAPPPPPPPEWLTRALQELLKSYPNDAFEATMRYCAFNQNDEVVSTPAPGAPIPPGVRFWYVPRIRCLDCPGKLYTPGPEMTVTNFEVHLKNRLHCEKVAARVAQHKAAEGQDHGRQGSATAVPSSASS